MKYSQTTIGSASNMAVSFFTNGIDLDQTFAFSIQANWSFPGGGTTGNGTVFLQASNDNVVPLLSGAANPAANVQNWTTISGQTSSTSISTGTSSYLWSIEYPGYRWVRMGYTSASGGGTMTVNYTGKGV